MIARSFIIAAFLISLVGCTNHSFLTGERISGNGDVVTETRDVGQFTELRVTGARTTVVYGDKNGPIRLTGESNILANTESYIDGDRLVITSKDNVSMNPTRQVEIEIPSTYVNYIRVSGSNRLILRNINQESFGVRGSGSTHIEADGVTDHIEIRMSGSSRIIAPNLKSVTAEVRTSGSSKAEIFVSESIESRSSGSSEILLYGSPGRIVNESSGSSRLRSVGD